MHIIRLSFSDHYPLKYVQVTSEELERLKVLENGYGSLHEAGQQGAIGEVEFVKDVVNRPRQAGPREFVVYQ